MMAEKIKILIVDDNEENRLILKRVAQKIQDVDIYEAKDGKVAIEKSRLIDPDIILMDIMMPELDGIEATKIIKKEFPSATILIITAIDDASVEENLLEIGANAYIRKPIDRKTTRYKIENFAELIRKSRHQCKVSSHRKSGAINPFSKDIRCFKVYFHIKDENDIMDFGSWLMDSFKAKISGLSFKLDYSLDTIYTILYTNLPTKGLLNIVVEEDFENIYATIDLDKPLSTDIPLHVETMQKNGLFCIKLPFEEQEKWIEKSTQLQTRELNQEEKEVLQKSTADNEVISAPEYLESHGGEIPDEIHDFSDLLEKWEETIEDMKFEFNEEHLHALADITYQLSTILNKLYDFMSLGYALSALSIYVRGLDKDSLDEDKRKKFATLMLLIKADLLQWWEEIFFKKTAINIHYLDSSLYSSCLQIEALFDEKTIEKDEDDDDLELF